MTGANDRTTVGMGSREWQTPREDFNRWNRLWRFDFDAWATHENALLPVYATAEGVFERRPNLSAEPRMINGHLSGLEYNWSGLRVFGNPPFNRPENACIEPHEKCRKKGCEARGFHVDTYIPGIEDFVAKHAAERNNAAINVALLPDARDTAWWRDFVKPYAIDFPLGRYSFVNPNTGLAAPSPPGGIVMAFFVPDWLGKP